MSTVVGVLTSNIFHPGPGLLKSADPTALAGPTRSKHGREGIDWPRNLSGRSRLLSTVGASAAAELQPPHSRCSGTQGVLDSALPTVGGQDFPSTWVRHTPFPDLSLFPFWKGTRVPDVSARWVASLCNFQVGLCWGLSFTQASRCLDAGLQEDGGGPQAGHRGPEGSGFREGAPCDDLLGIA